MPPSSPRSPGSRASACARGSVATDSRNRSGSAVARAATASTTSPRVVAVRRSVERGVPVDTAVTSAREQRQEGIDDAARVALAENAPVAIVVLSGPQPLRVEEVNAVVRARPGAPGPGDDLLALAPWYEEHPGFATLRSLFASSSMAAGCEHPDWTTGLVGTANGIAYRLPQMAGHPPLVAIVGVDTARERRLARELADAKASENEMRETIACTNGGRARRRRWSPRPASREAPPPCRPRLTSSCVRPASSMRRSPRT